MQQQRKMWAGGSRIQHGLKLFPLCDRGRRCGYGCGYVLWLQLWPYPLSIMAVVAVIVVVTMVVVADVARAEEIAFVA